MTALLVELVSVVLHQRQTEAVEGTERRAEVVRDRIVEGLELRERLLVSVDLVGQPAPAEVELQKDLDLAPDDLPVDRLEEHIHSARSVAAQDVLLGLEHRGEEDDRYLSRG